MSFHSGGGSQSRNHKASRELCFLCDLPKMPWAIINDFSEVVCRGCVNYEGTDRVEHVITLARLTKLQHGFISTSEPSRIAKSDSKKLFSNNSSRDEVKSNTQERSETGNSLHPVSTKHDPLPSPGRPAEPLPSPAVELPSPVRPGGIIDLARQYPLPVPTLAQAAPQLMSPAANLAYRQGMAAARIAAANWGQKVAKLPGIPGIPGLGGAPVVSSDGLTSPQTPGEECKPLTAPLNLDYSTKPPHIIAVLQCLARSAPFELRFKKAHSERGRVFAFDASHKTGMEYELKLYIEYPLGSGQVYTSASGVAKRMYYNSMKEQSRPLSSGFKYLEYEVRPDTGDWRLLGDLLPENVRAFKEPVKEEFLATPRVDLNYPALPKFTIHTGLDTSPPGSNSGRTSAERKSPKRKQTSDSTSSTGAPAAKRPASLQSPAARRPNSLSLSITTPSPSQEMATGSPATLANGNTSAVRQRPGIDELVERLTPTEVQSHLTTTSVPPTNLTHSMSITSQVSSTSSARSSLSDDRTEVKMKCYLCCSQLEDAHYVQCPTIKGHKFCFPCSKDSIKHQQVGSKKDVFCPSGKHCSLEGGKVPWAFLPAEIDHILSTYTAPKYNHDRSSNREDKNHERIILDRSSNHEKATEKHSTNESASSREEINEKPSNSVKVKQEREST